MRTIRVRSLADRPADVRAYVQAVLQRVGYRTVVDQAGRRVRIDVDRVVEHICERRDSPPDPSRWQLVPAIVPTIAKGNISPVAPGTYRLRARLASPDTTRERTLFAYLFRDGLRFSSILGVSSPKHERNRNKQAGFPEGERRLNPVGHRTRPERVVSPRTGGRSLEAPVRSVPHSSTRSWGPMVLATLALVAGSQLLRRAA